MEMLAPLAILWTAPVILKDKRINLYIDNDAASNTLIRGSCVDAFLSAMVRAFWKLAEEIKADIWIGRVGSNVDPSGLPTRHKKLPFPIRRCVHFRRLFALLLMTNKW